jgi:hypothetical protein
MEDAIDDIIPAYQELINELVNDNTKLDSKGLKNVESNEKNSLITTKQLKRRIKKANKHKTKEQRLDNKQQTQEEDENENSESDNDLNESKSTYSQEVLCKDNLETDESIINDPFSVHFEKSIDDKLIDQLKNKKIDNNIKIELKWKSLGNIHYSAPLKETEIDFKKMRPLQDMFIKQRILERLDTSIETYLGNNNIESKDIDEQIKTNSKASLLNASQLEILNIISNYADFYHSNVNVKEDNSIKFIYALHSLNHVLK